jgi:hypothetical protein
VVAVEDGCGANPRYVGAGFEVLVSPKFQVRPANQKDKILLTVRLGDAEAKAYFTSCDCWEEASLLLRCPEVDDGRNADACAVRLGNVSTEISRLQAQYTPLPLPMPQSGP